MRGNRNVFFLYQLSVLTPRRKQQQRKRRRHIDDDIYDEDVKKPTTLNTPNDQ